MNTLNNILILGGSKFVGKGFLNYIKTIKNINEKYKIFLANRGISGECDININRDIKETCRVLSQHNFDTVIDFSCYNLNQLRNTYYYLNFNKYIFISTTAVEGIPFKNVSPDLYEMARYAYNKKECEDFIINNTKNYCIIRPCYIVGEGDYTDRFRKIGDKYYWKDGNELGYYIEVDKLADIILNQLFNAKGSNIINPCVINQ